MPTLPLALLKSQTIVAVLPPTGRARRLVVSYGWAIAEGLADTNPVVGTRKAVDEIARDRVLADEELRLIWRHAGEGDYGAIIRLLILTGQRREEVAAMTWEELDLEGATWRITSDRTKNARMHEVPLTHPPWKYWALGVNSTDARLCSARVVHSPAGPKRRHRSTPVCPPRLDAAPRRVAAS